MRKYVVSAVTAVCLALGLTSAASAGVSAPAFGGCTGGWSTQDICKYDQSLVTLSGSDLSMYWKGATASDTCDPSNNVTQWRENGNRIYRNGAIVAGYGGGAWKTNCAIPGGATLFASRTKDAGTLTIDFFFQYTQGGTTYDSGLNGTWTVS